MNSLLHRVIGRSGGRASLLLIGLMVAFAVPSSASAAAFSARLHAPNHRPTANKRWYITVDVTHGRSKLSGSVRYQFVYNGTVVGHYPGHKFKHGVFHDWLLFPKRAVGITLSLRVVVSTRYGTVQVPWWVKTQA